MLARSAHVRCCGKGRKLRCTPCAVTSCASSRHPSSSRFPAEAADQPVFPSSRGGHLSDDAVERLVTRHATAAHQSCPSLARKRVTPHTLRHTTAMALLRDGVDRSVIALWLGHESIETTQIYLHADIRLKEQALAHSTPSGLAPGRYRPDDALLAFLEGL